MTVVLSESLMKRGMCSHHSPTVVTVSLKAPYFNFWSLNFVISNSIWYITIREERKRGKWQIGRWTTVENGALQAHQTWLFDVVQPSLPESLLLISSGNPKFRFSAIRLSYYQLGKWSSFGGINLMTLSPEYGEISEAVGNCKAHMEQNIKWLHRCRQPILEY